MALVFHSTVLCIFAVVWGWWSALTGAWLYRVFTERHSCCKIAVFVSNNPPTQFPAHKNTLFVALRAPPFTARGLNATRRIEASVENLYKLVLGHSSRGTDYCMRVEFCGSIWQAYTSVMCVLHIMDGAKCSVRGHQLVAVCKWKALA